MNGLIAADRSLKPHIWEVKKVYQNMAFRLADYSSGLVELKNKFFFTDLSDFTFGWRLEGNGKVLGEGTIDNVSLPAGETGIFKTNFPAINPEPGVEYFLNFYAYQKNDDGLLKTGDEMASEQVKLPFYQPAKVYAKAEKLSVSDGSQNDVTVNTGKMSVGIQNGALASIKYNGREMVKQGLRPNFWRPSTDNDLGSDLVKICDPWRHAGRDARLTKVEKRAVDDQTYEVVSHYQLPEKLASSDFIVKYTISGEGYVDVNCTFIPAHDTLPLMPRLGVSLTLQKEYDQMEWFGRTRTRTIKTVTQVPLLACIKVRFGNNTSLYDRPQENGNKIDVRWMTLSNTQGNGLKAVGAPYLSTSAYMFTTEELSEVDAKKHQRHMSDIQPKDMVTWNIDWKQMGLGGDTSWGAYPHQQYLIPARRMSYSFRLYPY